MIERSPRAVVFLHLFKCGGTTVIERLRRAVPAERFEHVRNPKAFRAVLSADPARAGTYDVVAGHIDMRLMERHFPTAHWVTVLRDPVDRMLSQYEHFRRAAARPDETGTDAHHFRAAFCADNDLAAFVTSEDPRLTVYTRNFMARKLAGGDDDGVDEAMLAERALAALGRFALVGTTDTLDGEFLPELDALVGGRRWALPRRRANASASRGGRRPALDRRTLSAILDRNRVDATLYAAARWFDPRSGAVTPAAGRATETAR